MPANNLTEGEQRQLTLAATKAAAKQHREQRQVALAATKSAAEDHLTRKTHIKGKKKRRKVGGVPPPIRGPPTAVYSIPGFCQAHGISQALYFRICKLGLGPEVMKVSSRTLISFESAARWRAMMTRRTTEAR